MKRTTPTRQSGYALILMVLALMGIGGVVLTGFTQGAKEQSEQQRYLHNERVLKEAKQALLQYAYNYPVLVPGRGPGRLPCPDIDNNGTPDPVPGCDQVAGVVGRFPWNTDDLNFYDARDASGERLWYAVSSNFGNSGTGAINSDTQGTITIQDRSGAALHDGTGNSGAVAVIIAPGPPIERGGVLQDRAAGANAAVNYLDLFGAVDNADFVNNDPNGFVTGPIFNPVDGSLAVNDQMIVITAAEVIAMAEMATLQAYRAAINDYLDNTGNVYPWLYNYEGADYVVGTETVDVAIDKLSTFYPADTSFATEKATYIGIDISGNNDGIFGRIPSMFAPYFSDGVDSGRIQSKLAIEIQNADFIGDLVYNRSFPSAASGTYTFVNTIWNGTPTEDGPANMDISFETAGPLVDLRFEDDTAPAPAPANVKLVGSIGADETYTIGQTFWFWSRNDIGVTEWAKCRSVHIVDCHVDSSYLPIPHDPGERSIQILKVDVEFVFDSGVADAIEFALNVNNLAGTPPVITPADANGHAQITATFAAADVVDGNSVIRIRYEWDDNYTDGNWDVDESGTLDFASMAGATLQLGLRYYPELPRWAFTNEWHNSVRMAYALEYEPPGTGPCIIDTTCLRLDDSPGFPQDKASLLVIAGTHDWQDLDVNGRLKNDVDTVFDNGNHNDNPTFYRHRGNDELLVIEEL